MNDMEKLAAGLAILLTYDLETGNASADHEVLYVEGPLPDDLSKEHREQLEASGWSWNSLYDSWEFMT